MNLKIMTYNIQHGHIHTKNFIDLDKMCEVIASFDPDIVGLNEVRGRGVHPEYTAQAEYMAAKLGMHCYFGRSIMVGGVNPYGNAVLSKFPIIEAKVTRIPDPIGEDPSLYHETRSLCRCVVEAGETPIAVYATHFGLTPMEKEHCVSAALAAMREEMLPLLLMGDFNLQPDDPLIAAMDRKLNATGALLGGKCSFPSDAPRIRIDYIYTSADIRVLSADVPQIMMSDHCPVVAEIEL